MSLLINSSSHLWLLGGKKNTSQEGPACTYICPHHIPMFVVYYTYSHAMSCHADVPRFFPHFIHHILLAWMSNNINRTISPGLLCASSLFVCKPLHPPNKKTFNSHCILLFCGLHPLRSIPPRLPRPLAPRLRLRPADAQQTHRFAAEQLFVLLVLAQLPRSGSGRKRLELWGRAELQGWKMVEGNGRYI